MNIEKYREHFLLDTSSVIEYVKACTDFFSEDDKLEAVEIGDGNINYVFKVTSESGKSLVVKQADKLLRSSGRPLDLHRNKIEAEILAMQYQLAPGSVPMIYDYNEAMYALTMEDISAYKNLRKELDKEIIFQHLAENISSFMVDTLIPTTDLVMDRHEKKRKVQLFTNVDLCDISEDLVFTEPYHNYKNRNIITKGMEEFVQEHLSDDKDLHTQVAILRNNFMNNAQALVHGDLHSGSIFVNQEAIKVIDPEFAFYGPMGYDIGNVIGNLFFSLTNKLCSQKDNSEYISWLQDTISKIYDLTKSKLLDKLNELVDFPLYNDEFQEKYVKCVMTDAVGYAGTEIIRRTVGDSKVREVESITDIEKRQKLEKILILFGKELILRRGDFEYGDEIVDLFGKVVNKI